MKWNRMRRTSILAAGCVLAALIGLGTAAHEGTSETQTEQPSAHSLSEKVPENLEIDLAQLAGELKDIDYEQLEEDINLVLKVISSEEFKNLMSYQEMRDLTETAIIKAGEFAAEDPELVGKIAVTLGANENTVNAIARLAQTLEESEMAREVVSTILENINMEDLSVELSTEAQTQ